MSSVPRSRLPPWKASRPNGEPIRHSSSTPGWARRSPSTASPRGDVHGGDGEGEHEPDARAALVLHPRRDVGRPARDPVDERVLLADAVALVPAVPGHVRAGDEEQAAAD